MKSTLSNVLMFAAGVAIGSAVTWKILRDKFERIAQEEIDSVKEVFSRRKTEPEYEARITKEKPNLTEYATKIKESGYSNEEKPKEEEGKTVDGPYVITPDEYGDCDDYDLVSLVYYADGVLTDGFGEIIENVDNMVGLDSLTHFGENEDDVDTVYVRNDDLGCDFEILRDNMPYAEVYGANTDPTED